MAFALLGFLLILWPPALFQSFFDGITGLYSDSLVNSLKFSCKTSFVENFVFVHLPSIDGLPKIRQLANIVGIFVLQNMLLILSYSLLRA